MVVFYNMRTGLYWFIAYPTKLTEILGAFLAAKLRVANLDLQALQRELREETGYQAQDSEIELLGEYDFISPRNDTFTYITYRVKLKNPYEVILEEAAHSEYDWLTIDEADKKDDLIHNLHDLFRLVGFVK